MNANPLLDADRLTADVYRHSYEEFVRGLWPVIVPERLRWNWHMSVMCREMQAVAERVFRGRPKEHDLVVNVSPGTSKSTLCSVMFPAWAWTRMPSARFICGSYSHPLALQLSHKTRDLVLSERYRLLFPEVRVRDDQAAKSHFATTAGGYRYAVGVRGSVLGMHGHFLLIDDPLDPTQAVSDLDLAACNRWLRETLSTRKVDKAATVTALVMQRLHQDDPTSLFLGRGNCRHVCLPAELTPKVRPRTLRRFYKGGLMDPVRLGKAVLDEMRGDLGEYAYAGQFLQQPNPPGGGMFKVDRLLEARPPDRFARRVRFWDKAGTRGGDGPYTAGVLIGKDDAGYFWVLDVVRDRVDSAGREALIKRVAGEDGPGVVVGVEQSGGEGGKQGAEDTVRNLAGHRVRVWKVGRGDGDKVDRADPFSVQVNSGNVRLKRFAPWARDYKDELQHFPLSRYKDQVDASAGAFHFVNKESRVIGAMDLDAV